ncbi:MAG: NuoM family protein [Spirosomataceae bacterium]
MLTLILLLIPILSGAWLLSTKESASASLSKNIALASSLVVFIGSVLLYTNLGDASMTSFQVNWIESLAISFHLAVDGISFVLILLTSLLTPLIILSTSKSNYTNPQRLVGLILLAEAALIGVFAAQDLFLFYFFFEAALIPVYFIAAAWGGENANRVTFKMFVYTIFGSLFMLVAIVYLFVVGKSSDMTTLVTFAQNLSSTEQGFLFSAFMIAFAIKMPLFPLHTWQPDAYTESPTPATMLLSGLLSKMGVYGLIRIAVPFFPAAVDQFGFSWMILSIAGLVYGSIIAVQQDNMKRLIAYSSFAHMGLMAAGVLTGTQEGLQGAIFQMFAHGVNAIGLFFVIQVIFERTGTYSLSALGGITQKTPALSIYFMIILLGSVALPLTNGFVGEFVLLKSVFDSHYWLGGIAGLTIIFGAVYMLRLMQKSMFGALSPQTENFNDVAGTETFVLFPIAFLVILTGVIPNLLLQLSEPAVIQIVAGIIK